MIRRYVDREGDGAFAHTAPSVSRRRLGEAGQDLLAIVMQFRDTPAATLESFVILERVLRDQFEISDRNDDKAGLTAVIRDPKDVPCDTVGNPADPDRQLQRAPKVMAISHRSLKRTVRMKRVGMGASRWRLI